jgi:hypothetical protein
MLPTLAVMVSGSDWRNERTLEMTRRMMLGMLALFVLPLNWARASVAGYRRATDRHGNKITLVLDGRRKLLDYRHLSVRNADGAIEPRKEGPLCGWVREHESRYVTSTPANVTCPECRLRMQERGISLTAEQSVYFNELQEYRRLLRGGPVTRTEVEQLLSSPTAAAAVPVE